VYLSEIKGKVRVFVHDITYSLLLVFIVYFILLTNRCSYCNCFSCLYLLWLFVFTVFVNCICSVFVVECVYIVCGLIVVPVPPGENLFAVNNNNNTAADVSCAADSVIK
jgi:hypothetical protein